MTKFSSNDTATQSLPMRLFRDAQDKRRAEKVEAELALIQKGLAEHLEFASPIADAAARYLLQAGGKRIRPVLTLLAADYGTGPNALVRQAAMAIELTHLASLYHDDVMDDARVRRGVDSAQVVWSNSVAILAGDLLFARASTLVSGMSEDAILLQAKTFERLCLGQLHETVGPAEGEDPIEHYLQVLADKTGALISTAARFGAQFGNAPAECLDAVTEYGERIGIAFQLIDDVIDLSPKAEATGKKAGTDLRAGVVTLPMLLLKQRAETNASDAALLARIEAGVAAAADGTHVEDLELAIAELRENDVTAETERQARQWAESAVRALDGLPNPSVTSALARLAEAVVSRQG